LVEGLDLAPGRGEVAPTIGQFDPEELAYEIGIGPPGSLFFRGSLLTGLNGPGGVVEESQDTGIWRHDGTTAHLVAREGDPAPGVPGTSFTPFGSVPTTPFSTGLGGLAFQAPIVIPGFLFTNEFGLWVDRGTGLDFVAR
ncbi:unnamed protein product, partial [Ectocarpus sp. 4 AP-2014]